MVDLKAELFRKQEEFKQQKLSNSASGCIKGKQTVPLKVGMVFIYYNVVM